ncbi:hypothetical protein BJX76DRAFT_344741 [Aspergillus varians]
MNQPTHVIDPDGEVIIVLRNAGSHFVLLDEEFPVNGVSSPPLNQPRDDVQSPAEASGFPESYREEPEPPRVISKPAAAEPAPEEPTAAEPPPEEPTAAELATEEPTTAEPASKDSTELGVAYEPPDEDCFRIQVSAKHLILASSVFKKMFTGGWKENIILLQKVSVEITAESWDIDAFLILLRIIHCQNYAIPRNLTLDMLAKVAVIADYYECKEAVYIWADIWMNALGNNIPTVYSRDLILWLWISWFFQRPAQFKEATSTVMSLSDKQIDNLGLPIPNNVISDINICRQRAIAGVLLRLRDTCDAFLSGSRGCCFECGSIMYGALAKQMQSKALLSPRPAAPFLNLNYKYLVETVLSFKSPKWYYSTPGYYAMHICLNSSFNALFGQLDSVIGGLEIESMMIKSESSDV